MNIHSHLIIKYTNFNFLTALLCCPPARENNAKDCKSRFLLFFCDLHAAHITIINYIGIQYTKHYYLEIVPLYMYELYT